MPRATRPIRIEGDTAYVPLTRGYEAIIDVADVDIVTGVSWQATIYKDKNGCISHVYATRRGPRGAGGQRANVKMHRLIVRGECEEVDHADGDGLNNRRSNLRPSSTSQNQMNSRAHVDSRTGIKGVSFCEKSQKWRSQIAACGVEKYLGRFESAQEAQNAYAAASKQLHGEFGRVA